jgi:hypothetical protein
VLDPPEWLSPDYILELSEKEVTEKSTFIELPIEHFFTVVFRIFEIASRGIPCDFVIFSLLFLDLRYSKNCAGSLWG